MASLSSSLASNASSFCRRLTDIRDAVLTSLWAVPGRSSVSSRICNHRYIDHIRGSVTACGRVSSSASTSSSGRGKTSRGPAGESERCRTVTPFDASRCICSIQVICATPHAAILRTKRLPTCAPVRNHHQPASHLISTPRAAYRPARIPETVSILSGRRDAARLAGDAGSTMPAPSRAVRVWREGTWEVSIWPGRGRCFVNGLLRFLASRDQSLIETDAVPESWPKAKREATLATMQTHQDPILQLSWVCWRLPNPKVRRGHCA
jgi:hypothetical protein